MRNGVLKLLITRSRFPAQKRRPRLVVLLVARVALLRNQSLTRTKTSCSIIPRNLTPNKTHLKKRKDYDLREVLEVSPSYIPIAPLRRILRRVLRFRLMGHHAFDVLTVIYKGFGKDRNEVAFR
jgi:hypothetical protein